MFSIATVICSSSLEWSMLSKIMACFFYGNNLVTCAYGRLELTVNDVLEEPSSLYSLLN